MKVLAKLRYLPLVSVFVRFHHQSRSKAFKSWHRTPKHPVCVCFIWKYLSVRRKTDSRLVLIQCDQVIGVPFCIKDVGYYL